MSTTIEGAVVALLAADATVAQLAGNRIAPMTDPQSVARPKITFYRTGTDRSTDAGGFTNDGPTGLAIATLQIDLWADSMLTAKQLADATRRVLNGYSGGMIQSAYIRDERETPAGLVPGAEKPVQRITQTYRVMFTDQEST